jgi:hypothetical protein
LLRRLEETAEVKGLGAQMADIAFAAVTQVTMTMIKEMVPGCSPA